MPSAVLRFDLRRGRSFRPTKRPPFRELPEEVVSEGDNARQAWMVAVVKNMLVQHAMRADASEDLGTIDQKHTVASADGTDLVAKIARTSERKSIKITSQHEVTTGLVPSPHSPRAAARADSGSRRTPGAVAPAADRP